LRSAPVNSACFASRMVLYFSSSALVISLSLVFQRLRGFFRVLYFARDENLPSKFQKI
jgi:hypothetical protein